jgi:Ca-activated chloride channel family protein
MKYRIFLSSLLISGLTACAVDQSDEIEQAGEVKSEQATRQFVQEVAYPSRPEEHTVVVTGKVETDSMTGTESGIHSAKRQDHDRVVDAREMQPAGPRLLAEQAMLDRSLPVHKGLVTQIAAPQSIRHAHEALYRERYQAFETQGIFRVTNDPVSTFSIDVDTGAYSNMRRWLNQGQLPPENAVRVEEFINYFDYDYPYPDSPETPFHVSTEVAPSPWNANTRLLRIGIQGYRVPTEQLPASNLVFLVDVSGSMQSADKLPLLQNALGMLVGQLDENDSISMVVYAGASGVVLPPTSGDRKAEIRQALNQLRAGGSTNGAAGIRLAYQLAQQNYIENGVNRVILATDGDFNVGLASTEELIDLVQRQRKGGIALTTLGFGSGNFNDHLLEQLADEGNGHYAYIDRLSEARKVLLEELSSTLLAIARDVKIQIEFNPAKVSEYRLIGYENRVLNEEDFNNDKVDAGEIGAGHRVTALYEISLTGSPGQRLSQRRYAALPGSHSAPEEPGSVFSHELAHLRIRYKRPGIDSSELIETPVLEDGTGRHGSDSFNFAAAVAAFGQKLRGGDFLEDFGYDDIARLARTSRGTDPHGYRSEFMQLVELAATLDRSAEVAQHVENH